MRYHRFLIFGFDDYYPSGGLYDVFGTAQTLEQAIAIIRHGDTEYENYHILDTLTLKRYDPEGNHDQ